jgi:site-specific recombinase XerD
MVSAGDQRMVFRAGLTAGFLPRPQHMLRHSGHDARAIQHYLGHRSTASMVRYTALAPDRFKEFWKD